MHNRGRISHILNLQLVPWNILLDAVCSSRDLWQFPSMLFLQFVPTLLSPSQTLTCNGWFLLVSESLEYSIHFRLPSWKPFWLNQWVLQLDALRFSLARWDLIACTTVQSRVVVWWSYDILFEIFFAVSSHLPIDLCPTVYTIHRAW